MASLFLALFLFFSWRWAPSRWLDAAANKKGRKIIEKVEQPRSLARTCREACRLYRHARPRDGHEHFDMLSQGIYLYLSWQSNIFCPLRFIKHYFSICEFISGTLTDRMSYSYLSVVPVLFRTNLENITFFISVWAAVVTRTVTR